MKIDSVHATFPSPEIEDLDTGVQRGCFEGPALMKECMTVEGGRGRSVGVI